MDGNEIGVVKYFCPLTVYRYKAQEEVPCPVLAYIRQLTVAICCQFLVCAAFLSGSFVRMLSLNPHPSAHIREDLQCIIPRVCVRSIYKKIL